MKLGISISTHSNENTPIERYDIIESCLQSLVDNKPEDLIVNIVSDGITEEHRKLLKKYPFDHIEREINGGVAKTKNTSINQLLLSGCDIGFLSDDDMIFKDKELFNAYSDAMTRTEIPHYCLFLEDNGENCNIKNINGVDIKQTPWVNGCFLTFNRKLIEDVGYFKILSYKYGHEHGNFTRRVTHQGHNPFYCDIINSKELIDINVDSLSGINSMGIIDQELFQKNAIESTEGMNEYIKLIE